MTYLDVEPHERFERCNYVQSPRSFRNLPQLVVEFEVASEIFHDIEKVFFLDKTVLSPITEEGYKRLTEYAASADRLLDSPVIDGTEVRFGLKRDSRGAIEFHINADDNTWLQTNLEYLTQWVEDLNSYTHYGHKNLKGSVV